MFSAARYGARAPLLRCYSILKKLPKVPGNPPAGNQAGGAAKPNRFAQMFDGPKQNKPTHKLKQGGNANKANKKPAAPAAAAPKAPAQKSAAEIEREKAEAYKQMKAKMKAKMQQTTSKGPATASKSKKKTEAVSKDRVKLKLPPLILVASLAGVIQVPLNKVYQTLEGYGFEGMRHNYILTKENASLIADEYGFDVEFLTKGNDDLFPAPVNEKLVKPRPPVVTIMGHVDHGKTTILDFLRKLSVVDQEFGGITQHIGAFSVKAPVLGKRIAVLDTPGHAAFLKMRERGAVCTDIVVLVVAGDDGVMPQTIEAIKHTHKAGVPVIVAINKCDKPGVDVQKIYGELATHDMVVEEYGGTVQCVQVSGKTGLNMDKLEEAIVTLAEISNLEAEPTGVAAEGWVIELQVQTGVGPVATVLVRRGTVKNGDVVVAGTTYCRVRGMKDEHGKTVKQAGPSTPVQMWGWKELPEGGDSFIQAGSELVAKKALAYRAARDKQIQAMREIETINEKRLAEAEIAKTREKINELKMAGLDALELEAQLAAATTTTCHYLIKSDVFGLAEAIRELIDGLGNDEVLAKVVSHEAGAPTDSDIDLAKTLGATIFAFNIKTPKAIAIKAEQEGVTISEHNVIYRLIDQVRDELLLHLKPIIETKVVASADIKGVFELEGKGKKVTKIAGCKVTRGSLKRNSQVRVTRDGDVLYEGGLSSLKHLKDDVDEVKKGNECGVMFDTFKNFKQGDTLEVVEHIEHKQTL